MIFSQIFVDICEKIIILDDNIVSISIVPQNI